VKTQITIEESIGKTVASILSSEISNQLVVNFTDQTFTAFGIESGYDNDHTITPTELNWFDFGIDTLIEAQLCTQEDCDAWRQESEQVFLEKQKKWDQDTYTRLKAKLKK